MALHGDQLQVEALARTITDDGRSTALIATARAAAAVGNRHSALILAAEVEPAARVAKGFMPGYELAELVEIVAIAGDLHKAHALAVEVEALAPTAFNPHQEAHVLTRLVRALAAVGDTSRIRTLSEHVEDVTRSMNTTMRAKAVTELVEAMAVGDHNGALVMATRAGVIARSIIAPRDRADAMTALANAVASAGRRQSGLHASRQR
jgi:hypothetical protein